MNLQRHISGHCLSDTHEAVRTALWVVVSAIFLLSLPGNLSLADDASDTANYEFFERKIRPVLIKHCYECHSEDSDDLGGGLLLDSKQGTLTGGDNGAAIAPGDPGGSLLLSALEYRDFEMPPEGKLPDGVIADFRRWIRMGAPDPRTKVMKPPIADESEQASQLLWSLQPVSEPPLPAVNDDSWARVPADYFVQARLQEVGLPHVEDATPADRLRRVHFDLIGLPPSPETLARLEADPSEQTYAEIVDELLASPHFGERWARHWFDVVRYAESAGNSRDVLMPYAWRYRDYVIDALNNDVPYDRFVQEQIAGDLIAASSEVDDAERDRLRVATGLLAIGSKSLNGGNLELDLADDQIDVIGKAVLGMTIACARCHDHKFDPIPTADYYALAGIFRSTNTFYGGGTKRPKSLQDKLKVYLPVGVTPGQIQQVTNHQKTKARLQKEKAGLAKQIAKLEKTLPKDWQKKKEQLAGAIASDMPGVEDAAKDVEDAAKREEASESADAADQRFLKRIERFEDLQQKLEGVEKELNTLDEQALPEIGFAIGVRDANKIADSSIHERGEKNRAGEVVPRGFLSCVETVEGVEIDSSTSGRLELAQWLTDPRHPLTPRVIVNRIWQHMFGHGLVASVDNFGINGAQPTHPALLDHLAYRFVHEHKWSIKSMIRELALSRTYGQAATYVAANFAVDPENNFYWRMSRRRLEAEALRDAMLANSGELIREPLPESLVTRIGEGEVGRGINTSHLNKPFLHRSVYLPIIRGIVPEFLKVFDLPEPSNPQGLRDVTNVPAQSLFLMNSPFVMARAEALAERLAKLDSEEKRIRQLFRICFSRDPLAAEVDRSREFLQTTRQQLASISDNEEARTEIQTWTLLCQSMFASAEYRLLD